MKPGESLVSPNSVTVTDGYFEAMGMRLARGRFFDARDTPTSPLGGHGGRAARAALLAEPGSRSAAGCTSQAMRTT